MEGQSFSQTSNGHEAFWKVPEVTAGVCERLFINLWLTRLRRRLYDTGIRWDAS